MTTLETIRRFTFNNPVETFFGYGSLKKLSDFTDTRKVALITTPGSLDRGILDRVFELTEQVFDPLLIAEPPTFEWFSSHYSEFWKAHKDCELITAIGGGSVIDTAKVLSVKCLQESMNDFTPIKDHLEGQSQLEAYVSVPIIAIPTTAGTGSEVTPWASLWNLAEQKKYSLHLPTLWPRVAIIDPELTMTVPWQTTLVTALDALSHGLEAIWNKNANIVSTSLAIDSARTIMSNLPLLKKRLDNRVARIQMHRASLLAGLAFSNTKTALAHALSYPFTIEYDVLHGLACSFTLPSILRHNRGITSECDAALSRIFSTDIAEADGKLKDFLHSFDLSTDFRSYGATDKEMREIIENVRSNHRFENNINPSLDGLLDCFEKEQRT